LRALLARNPSLDPALLDDVILGCVNQAGEDNRNVARMALLLAGLPVLSRKARKSSFTRSVRENFLLRFRSQLLIGRSGRVPRVGRRARFPGTAGVRAPRLVCPV
jgi:hypothetical protein